MRETIAPSLPLSQMQAPTFCKGKWGLFQAVIKQTDEANAPSVCFEKREREKMKKIGIRQGGRSAFGFPYRALSMPGKP